MRWEPLTISLQSHVAQAGVLSLFVERFQHKTPRRDEVRGVLIVHDVLVVSYLCEKKRSACHHTPDHTPCECRNRHLCTAFTCIRNYSENRIGDRISARWRRQHLIINKTFFWCVAPPSQNVYCPKAGKANQTLKLLVTEGVALFS